MRLATGGYQQIARDRRDAARRSRAARRRSARSSAASTSRPRSRRRRAGRRAVHAHGQGHERRRQRDPGDQLVRHRRGAERLDPAAGPRHAADDAVPAPAGPALGQRDLHVRRADRDHRARRRGQRAGHQQRHHDRARARRPRSGSRASPPGWAATSTPTLRARLVDAFDNGVPGPADGRSSCSRAPARSTPIDSLTDATRRRARRLPEPAPARDATGCAPARSAWSRTSTCRPRSWIPSAAGGTITNYPNPFHPPLEGTTLAYVLADDATRHAADLHAQRRPGAARRSSSAARPAARGAERVGLGRPQRRAATWSRAAATSSCSRRRGLGETLHVIRRKIAVVR